MRNKCFVICDSEQEYAARVSALLAKKTGYQIHVCSSMKEVRRIAEDKNIGVFLIEEEFPAEEVQAEETILLVKEKYREEGNAVFKYQSFENIFSKILAVCAGGGQTAILKQQLYSDCRLIGVYSPVNRVGKTAFAIALGKEAAKVGRTLYLNMEAYSGWEERVGKQEQYTLADLLYYAKQEKGNLDTRLGTMVGYMEELEYIAPMVVSEDLKAVSLEEWKELLELLQSRRIYKRIIIDFGECVQGLWELLNLCGEIYMPVREDKESYAKIMQFEKNAGLLGYGKLEEKIVKLELGRDILKTAGRIMRRKEWKDDRGGGASRKDSAGA